MLDEQLYHPSQTQKVIKNYVCATCWSNLTAWNQGDLDLVACARYPEEHRGFHSKRYVERVSQEDAGLAIEAKQALYKAGVLEDPHKGKTTKQLLDELGF